MPILGTSHVDFVAPIFLSDIKPITGYHLIKPEDLFWWPSNLMQIPTAEYLERTV